MRDRIRFISLFTLVLSLCSILIAPLLSSCSLSPGYTRPPSPVPARAGEESSLGVGGKAASAADSGAGAVAGSEPLLSEDQSLPLSETSVAEFFPEPRLVSLIRLAFLNNRDLRLSMLSIARAKAGSALARAERFPWLEGEMGISIEGGQDRDTSRSYSGEIMVPAFELDLFGRAKDMEAKAFEEFLSSYENFRAFRISLITGVAEAYFETRLLSEKESLIQRTLKSYEDSLAFVENRVISGQASLLDLEEAGAQVDLAKASLLDLRVNKTKAENSLKILLGTFEGEGDLGLPPPKKLKDITPPDLSKRSIPSIALLKRPDILAAEHMLIAGHFDVGAARAAFFPKISLTGALSFMSMDLSSLFGSGSSGWSYSPNLSIPIFNAGSNRANLSIAEIGKEEALINYEKAIQNAFKETQDALLTLDNLKARLDAEKKRLSSQRRVLELATVRYRSGSVSYLEVLNSQRGVFEAEEMVLEAEKNLLSGYLSLFAALGGGINTEGLELPDVPYGTEALEKTPEGKEGSE
jgi:NodT family efflux transporter outer membrane factor (OMF) lipoprotein